MSSGVNLFVPRVTQLDTYEFDKEIHNVMKKNFSEITRYFRPGFFNNFRHEINLLIELLVFKYSLLKNNSTFGQQLLNVEYQEPISTKKAIWYSLLNLFVPYLKKKLDYFLINTNAGNIRKLILWTETWVQICQFVNLLVFLRQGIFPDFVDRLLALKMIPKSTLNRNIGYSYMSRELLWHGFMELLMNTLPLVNYHYVKKKILSALPRNRNKLQMMKKEKYSYYTKCSICGELPIYPCQISMNCQHVACYYCLKSNIMADSDYTCPSCGVNNTANIYFRYLNDS